MQSSFTPDIWAAEDSVDYFRYAYIFERIIPDPSSPSEVSLIFFFNESSFTMNAAKVYCLSESSSEEGGGVRRAHLHLKQRAIKQLALDRAVFDRVKKVHLFSDHKQYSQDFMTGHSWVTLLFRSLNSRTELNMQEVQYKLCWRDAWCVFLTGSALRLAPLFYGVLQMHCFPRGSRASERWEELNK